MREVYRSPPPYIEVLNDLSQNPLPYMLLYRESRQRYFFNLNNKRGLKRSFREKLLHYMDMRYWAMSVPLMKS